MERFLLVSFAGALGTATRYLIGLGAVRFIGEGWPYGTLAVNLIGCFFMAAVLTYATAASDFSPTLRIALTTGFMGGLTTYSAFNWETTKLYADRGALPGSLYIGMTLGGCLAMGLLGAWFARRFIAP
jgi:CrcB protein